MARPLMYQARPWLPVEITMRCLQGRLLLKPGSEANRRILGVLGRAMELYAGRVELYFAGGTSNHLHILAAFESAEVKALWKSHVKTNISKELGELYDWSGSHWDRRCRDIHILDDEAFAGSIGEARPMSPSALADAPIIATNSAHAPTPIRAEPPKRADQRTEMPLAHGVGG